MWFISKIIDASLIVTKTLFSPWLRTEENGFRFVGNTVTDVGSWGLGGTLQFYRNRSYSTLVLFLSIFWPLLEELSRDLCVKLRIYTFGKWKMKTNTVCALSNEPFRLWNYWTGTVRFFTLSFFPHFLPPSIQDG